MVLKHDQIASQCSLPSSPLSPPVFSLDKLQKKLQPLCRRWLSRITTRADNKGHAVGLFSSIDEVRYYPQARDLVFWVPLRPDTLVPHEFIHDPWWKLMNYLFKTYAKTRPIYVVYVCVMFYWFYNPMLQYRISYFTWSCILSQV